ncbi:MAG: hypothetical protein ACXVBK_13430 [Flavisolibacter sp.]
MKAIIGSSQLNKQTISIADVKTSKLRLKALLSFSSRGITGSTGRSGSS